MSTLDTFVANLGHAIRNHETVTIGGGEFRPSELVEILEAIKLGQQVASNADTLLGALDHAAPPDATTPVQAISKLRGVLRAYEEITE